MIKQLLITAGVALVFGGIGAMGYAYFADPKSKEPSSDKAQGEGDSGSKKESGSNEKSDGGKSQKSAKASTADSVPGDSAGEDAQTVMHQIKDLSQRVDQLRERVDNATRPADETAPVLRMMQIKVSELAREKAEVSALAAAHRRFDDRLEILREELNTLRIRIEATQADSTGVRIPGPPVLSTTPTARKD